MLKPFRNKSAIKGNFRIVDLKKIIATRLLTFSIATVAIVSVMWNVTMWENTEFLVIQPSKSYIEKIVNRSDNIFHQIVFDKRHANKELKCMVSNIYFEAAQESVAGKLAVALVTMNRVANPAFPNTVCDVVFEGSNRKDLLCQFSWTCSPAVNKSTPKTTTSWEESEKIAKIVMFQKESIVDITGGAIYYHADYVNPKWSKIHKKTVTIDRHIFYTQGVDKYTSKAKEKELQIPARTKTATK
jgi:spore germination cell wall hydrolase CwlJ-like protein